MVVAVVAMLLLLLQSSQMLSLVFMIVSLPLQLFSGMVTVVMLLLSLLRFLTCNGLLKYVTVAV